MVGNGTIFEGPNSLETDPQIAFRVLAPGELPPPGTILVDDCRFSICRFHDVEFVHDILRTNGMKRIFHAE
jgi:hypothetical protein